MQARKGGDRWRVQASAPATWQSWLERQPEYDRTKDAELLWLVVKMNGEISKSGRGLPPWDAIVKELPEKDSIQTRVFDGSGV